MAKKGNLLFWICALSTVAAIGVHLYLIDHHYNFKYGHGAAESVCNVSETVNCNRTTASAYSEIFGIPVSIPGLLINAILLCLLIAFRYPIVSSNTQKNLARPIRLISLGIFGVSLVMAFISYGLLKTVCPMCSAAYVISLVTLATALPLTSGASLFAMPDLKLYGVLVALVGSLSFVGHQNSMSKFGGKERIKMIQLQFEDWKRGQTKKIETVSPLVANPSGSAKMKMVEFADFLCGHCANAFPVLHTFVKSHPDVEFSFQAFPLDGACNSAIQHSEGTRCLLAQISHCAGQQGDPWPTQKWIFENQQNLLSKDQVQTRLKEKVSELGLDEASLMSCVESEETREIIRQQAEKGIEAGVKGTPSLFINGKKIPGGFSLPLFEKIYSETKRR